MKQLISVILILISVLIAAGCGKSQPVGPVENTPTYTATGTITLTGTITPTWTDSMTMTVTPTRTNTATPTETRTSTGTATDTVTFTATGTSTSTKTVTRTATETQTFTITETSSATPTVTNTPLSVTVYYEATPPGYTGSKDTHINSAAGYQDRNWGAAAANELSSSYGYPERFLIEFDLSGQLPVSSVAVGAELVITVNNANGNMSGFGITPFKLTREWAEGICTGAGCTLGYCTWLNYDTGLPWTNPGGDFDTAPAGPSKLIVPGPLGTKYSFAVYASTINGWLADPGTNNGLILKCDDENSATNDSLMIYTKNSTTPAYRPRFTVYYY